MPPYQNQPPNPPEFPAPAPQAPTPDPYEFFLAQQKTSKKRAFGGNSGGPSMATKVLFGVFSLLFFGISMFILFNIVLGGEDTSAPVLAVASQQKETLRVAQAGAKQVNSSQLKVFVSTADVSLASAQKELITYLTKKGVKVDAESLPAMAGVTATDKALASSLTTNTYDSTFTSIMQASLNKYLERLESAAALATTRTEKALLEKQASEARLLSQLLNGQ